MGTYSGSPKVAAVEDNTTEGTLWASMVSMRVSPAVTLLRKYCSGTCSPSHQGEGGESG